MKQFIFLSFLIFVSCKEASKTKTETQTTTTEIESENVIDKSVVEMWKNYIESNPEFKEEEIPESDFFHNNTEDAKRLAELTLNRKKKASSGLYSLYQKYNIDLPKIGAKQIVTDFDGKAQAIIENRCVDTIPFNEISKEYAALDMGTNIEPLKKWKKAHWDFFEPFLKESGEQPTEEMLIVCINFETIWPQKH